MNIIPNFFVQKFNQCALMLPKFQSFVVFSPLILLIGIFSVFIKTVCLTKIILLSKANAQVKVHKMEMYINFSQVHNRIHIIFSFSPSLPLSFSFTHTHIHIQTDICLIIVCQAQYNFNKGQLYPLTQCLSSYTLVYLARWLPPLFCLLAAVG